MGSRTIFIVTGTSAAGKSRTVAPLRRLLGGAWEVWDIDDIVWNLPDHGHPEMPRLTGWKHGDDQSDFDRCKNVVLADAAACPREVVLCGTLLPHEVFAETKTLFAGMRWLGLFAAPEVIRARLAERNWDPELVEVHATSHRWFAPLGEQVEGGMPLVDTSPLAPDEVAGRIVAWMRSHGADVEGG